jgi:hypothetical protein
MMFFNTYLNGTIYQYDISTDIIYFTDSGDKLSDIKRNTKAIIRNAYLENYNQKVRVSLQGDSGYYRILVNGNDIGYLQTRGPDQY